MDKLDEALLERIEKALNIKLYDWQKNYILDIPMVLDMRITGRRTGKTLAYVIKLLLTDGAPVRAFDITNIYFLADDYHDSYTPHPCHDNYYTRWFRNYLLDIYKCITSCGIKTRPVFISISDEFEYYISKNQPEIKQVVVEVDCPEIIKKLFNEDINTFKNSIKNIERMPRY